MKKTLYIVESQPAHGKDGDIFDTFWSFDRDEAIKRAEYEFWHMTNAERARTIVSVNGYVVDVDPDETAEAAWERIGDEELCPFADADEYVEIA